MLRTSQQTLQMVGWPNGWRGCGDGRTACTKLYLLFTLVHAGPAAEPDWMWVCSVIPSEMNCCVHTIILLFTGLYHWYT